jgi:hypothetical protein
VADSWSVGTVLKRSLPFVFVAVASVWIAFANTATGDYPMDAGPAVHALAHGHLSAYLSSHPVMGPFAVLVQAPFAAVSGGDGLVEMQWATLPCLLAAGLLGLYLAGIARRRGVSDLGQFLLAAVCLVNPLTFSALQFGHPEEILTAALAVGAVATASEGHSRRTAVLLGLAIASKQWAVIAILPVLMALPARRVRVGLGAAAIVLVLSLPALLASPGSFSNVQGNAASAGRIASVWSAWYPLSEVTTEAVGPTHLTAHVHRTPPLVGSLSHPLIVLLALGLPLALALRRGSFGLRGPDAMALLALLALLRCVLDPVDILYYHAPLLLAVFGWDALAARGLPLRSLVAVSVAALFWRWSNNLTDPQVLNAAYLAAISMAGALIATTLFRGALGSNAGAGNWPGISQVSGASPDFSR